MPIRQPAHGSAQPGPTSPEKLPASVEAPTRTGKSADSFICQPVFFASKVRVSTRTPKKTDTTADLALQ